MDNTKVENKDGAPAVSKQSGAKGGKAPKSATGSTRPFNFVPLKGPAKAEPTVGAGVATGDVAASTPPTKAAGSENTNVQAGRKQKHIVSRHAFKAAADGLYQEDATGVLLTTTVQRQKLKAEIDRSVVGAFKKQGLDIKDRAADKIAGELSKLVVVPSHQKDSDKKASAEKKGGEKVTVAAQSGEAVATATHATTTSTQGQATSRSRNANKSRGMVRTRRNISVSPASHTAATVMIAILIFAMSGCTGKSLEGGCVNGKKLGNFDCVCQHGWKGTNCDRPTVFDCGRGEMGGSGKCNCPEGATGDHCELDKCMACGPLERCTSDGCICDYVKHGTNCVQTNNTTVRDGLCTYVVGGGPTNDCLDDRFLIEATTEGITRKRCDYGWTNGICVKSAVPLSALDFFTLNHTTQRVKRDTDLYVSNCHNHFVSLPFYTGENCKWVWDPDMDVWVLECDDTFHHYLEYDRDTCTHGANPFQSTRTNCSIACALLGHTDWYWDGTCSCNPTGCVTGTGYHGLAVAQTYAEFCFHAHRPTMPSHDACEYAYGAGTAVAHRNYVVMSEPHIKLDPLPDKVDFMFWGSALPGPSVTETWNGLAITGFETTTARRNTCFQRTFTWVPNLPPSDVTYRMSAADCQTMCEQSTECSAYDLGENAGYCYIWLNNRGCRTTALIGTRVNLLSCKVCNGTFAQYYGKTYALTDGTCFWQPCLGGVTKSLYAIYRPSCSPHPRVVEEAWTVGGWAVTAVQRHDDCVTTNVRTDHYMFKDHEINKFSAGNSVSGFYRVDGTGSCEMTGCGILDSGYTTPPVNINKFPVDVYGGGKYGFSVCYTSTCLLRASFSITNVTYIASRTFEVRANETCLDEKPDGRDEVCNEHGLCEYIDIAPATNISVVLMYSAANVLFTTVPVYLLSARFGLGIIPTVLTLFSSAAHYSQRVAEARICDPVAGIFYHSGEENVLLEHAAFRTGMCHTFSGSGGREVTISISRLREEHAMNILCGVPQGHNIHTLTSYDCTGDCAPGGSDDLTEEQYRLNKDACECWEGDQYSDPNVGGYCDHWWNHFSASKCELNKQTKVTACNLKTYAANEYSYFLKPLATGSLVGEINVLDNGVLTTYPFTTSPGEDFKFSFPSGNVTLVVDKISAIDFDSVYTNGSGTYFCPPVLVSRYCIRDLEDNARLKPSQVGVSWSYMSACRVDLVYHKTLDDDITRGQCSRRGQSCELKRTGSTIRTLEWRLECQTISFAGSLNVKLHGNWTEAQVCVETANITRVEQVAKSATGSNKYDTFEIDFNRPTVGIFRCHASLGHVESNCPVGVTSCFVDVVGAGRGNITLQCGSTCGTSETLFEVSVNHSEARYNYQGGYETVRQYSKYVADTTSWWTSIWNGLKNILSFGHYAVSTAILSALVILALFLFLTGNYVGSGIVAILIVAIAVPTAIAGPSRQPGTLLVLDSGCFQIDGWSMVVRGGLIREMTNQKDPVGCNGTVQASQMCVFGKRARRCRQAGSVRDWLRRLTVTTSSLRSSLTKYVTSVVRRGENTVISFSWHRGKMASYHVVATYQDNLPECDDYPCLSCLGDHTVSYDFYRVNSITFKAGGGGCETTDNQFYQGVTSLLEDELPQPRVFYANFSDDFLKQGFYDDYENAWSECGEASIGFIWDKHVIVDYRFLGPCVVDWTNVTWLVREGQTGGAVKITPTRGKRDTSHAGTSSGCYLLGNWSITFVQGIPTQIQFGRIADDCLTITGIDIRGDGKRLASTVYDWLSRVHCVNTSVCTHAHDVIRLMERVQLDEPICIQWVGSDLVLIDFCDQPATQTHGTHHRVRRSNDDRVWHVVYGGDPCAPDWTKFTKDTIGLTSNACNCVRIVAGGFTGINVDGNCGPWTSHDIGTLLDESDEPLTVARVGTCYKVNRGDRQWKVCMATISLATKLDQHFLLCLSAVVALWYSWQWSCQICATVDAVATFAVVALVASRDSKLERCLARLSMKINAMNTWWRETSYERLLLVMLLGGLATWVEIIVPLIYLGPFSWAGGVYIGAVWGVDSHIAHRQSWLKTFWKARKHGSIDNREEGLVELLTRWNRRILSHIFDARTIYTGRIRSQLPRCTEIGQGKDQTLQWRHKDHNCYMSVIDSWLLVPRHLYSGDYCHDGWHISPWICGDVAAYPLSDWAHSARGLAALRKHLTGKVEWSSQFLTVLGHEGDDICIRGFQGDAIECLSRMRGLSGRFIQLSGQCVYFSEASADDDTVFIRRGNVVTPGERKVCEHAKHNNTYGSQVKTRKAKENLSAFMTAMLPAGEREEDVEQGVSDVGEQPPPNNPGDAEEGDADAPIMSGGDSAPDPGDVHDDCSEGGESVDSEADFNRVEPGWIEHVHEDHGWQVPYKGEPLRLGDINVPLVDRTVQVVLKHTKSSDINEARVKLMPGRVPMIPDDGYWLNESESSYYDEVEFVSKDDLGRWCKGARPPDEGGTANEQVASTVAGTANKVETAEVTAERQEPNLAPELGPTQLSESNPDTATAQAASALAATEPTGDVDENADVEGTESYSAYTEPELSVGHHGGAPSLPKPGTPNPGGAQMKPRRRLKLKQEFLNQIRRGAKTIELRAAYPTILKIKAGDVLELYNPTGGSISVDVVDTRRYETIEQALDCEDGQACLPGCGDVDEQLRRITRIRALIDGMRRHGVVAIQISLRPTTPPAGLDGAGEELSGSTQTETNAVKQVLLEWSTPQSFHMPVNWATLVRTQPAKLEPYFKTPMEYFRDRVLATAYWSPDDFTTGEDEALRDYYRLYCKLRLSAVMNWLGKADNDVEELLTVARSDNLLEKISFAEPDQYSPDQANLGLVRGGGFEGDFRHEDLGYIGRYPDIKAGHNYSSGTLKVGSYQGGLHPGRSLYKGSASKGDCGKRAVSKTTGQSFGIVTGRCQYRGSQCVIVEHDCAPMRSRPALGVTGVKPCSDKRRGVTFSVPDEVAEEAMAAQLRPMMITRRTVPLPTTSGIGGQSDEAQDDDATDEEEEAEGESEEEEADTSSGDDVPEIDEAAFKKWIFSTEKPSVCGKVQKHYEMLTENSKRITRQFNEKIVKGLSGDRTYLAAASNIMQSLFECESDVPGKTLALLRDMSELNIPEYILYAMFITREHVILHNFFSMLRLAYEMANVETDTTVGLSVGLTSEPILECRCSGSEFFVLLPLTWTRKEDTIRYFVGLCAGTVILEYHAATSDVTLELCEVMHKIASPGVVELSSRIKRMSTTDAIPVVCNLETTGDKVVVCLQNNERVGEADVVLDPTDDATVWCEQVLRVVRQKDDRMTTTIVIITPTADGEGLGMIYAVMNLAFCLRWTSDQSSKQVILNGNTAGYRCGSPFFESQVKYITVDPDGLIRRLLEKLANKNKNKVGATVSLASVISEFHQINSTSVVEYIETVLETDCVLTNVVTQLSVLAIARYLHIHGRDKEVDKIECYFEGDFESYMRESGNVLPSCYQFREKESSNIRVVFNNTVVSNLDKIKEFFGKENYERVATVEMATPLRNSIVAFERGFGYIDHNGVFSSCRHICKANQVMIRKVYGYDLVSEDYKLKDDDNDIVCTAERLELTEIKDGEFCVCVNPRSEVKIILRGHTSDGAKGVADSFTRIDTMTMGGGLRETYSLGMAGWSGLPIFNAEGKLVGIYRRTRFNGKNVILGLDSSTQGKVDWSKVTKEWVNQKGRTVNCHFGTGTGKSTHAIKELCKNHELKTGQKANVLSLQPLRRAVVGVSKYLSATFSGCTILSIRGGDSEITLSPTTHNVVYMTYGKAAAMLAADMGAFGGYDYIHFDEVHVATHNPEVLAVVTLLDSGVFRDTTCIKCTATPNEAANANTQHKVTRLQPSDVLFDGESDPSKTVNVDGYSLDLAKCDKYHGSILVFCSSIEQCSDAAAHATSCGYTATAVHSKNVDDTAEAAENSRFVFATDAIESSVTLPDLTLVINTGKCIRPVLAGKENNIEKLEKQDTTCKSDLQREGRVGRTKPGYSCRLTRNDKVASPTIDAYTEKWAGWFYYQITKGNDDMEHCALGRRMVTFWKGLADNLPDDKVNVIQNSQLHPCVMLGLIKDQREPLNVTLPVFNKIFDESRMQGADMRGISRVFRSVLEGDNVDNTVRAVSYKVTQHSMLTAVSFGLASVGLVGFAIDAVGAFTNTFTCDEAIAVYTLTTGSRNWGRCYKSGAMSKMYWKNATERITTALVGTTGRYRDECPPIIWNADGEDTEWSNDVVSKIQLIVSNSCVKYADENRHKSDAICVIREPTSEMVKNLENVLSDKSVVVTTLEGYDIFCKHNSRLMGLCMVSTAVSDEFIERVVCQWEHLHNPGLWWMVYGVFRKIGQVCFRGIYSVYHFLANLGRRPTETNRRLDNMTGLFRKWAKSHDLSKCDDTDAIPTVETEHHLVDVFMNVAAEPSNLSSLKAFGTAFLAAVVLVPYSIVGGLGLAAITIMYGWIKKKIGAGAVCGLVAGWAVPAFWESSMLGAGIQALGLVTMAFLSPSAKKIDALPYVAGLMIGGVPVLSTVKKAVTDWYTAGGVSEIVNSVTSSTHSATDFAGHVLDSRLYAEVKEHMIPHVDGTTGIVRQGCMIAKRLNQIQRQAGKSGTTHSRDIQAIVTAILGMVSEGTFSFMSIAIGLGVFAAWRLIKGGLAAAALVKNLGVSAIDKSKYSTVLMEFFSPKPQFEVADDIFESVLGGVAVIFNPFSLITVLIDTIWTATKNYQSCGSSHWGDAFRECWVRDSGEGGLVVFLGMLSKLLAAKGGVPNRHSLAVSDFTEIISDLPNKIGKMFVELGGMVHSLLDRFKEWIRACYKAVASFINSGKMGVISKAGDPVGLAVESDIEMQTINLTSTVVEGAVSLATRSTGGMVSTAIGSVVGQVTNVAGRVADKIIPKAVDVEVSTPTLVSLQPGGVFMRYVCNSVHVHGDEFELVIHHSQHSNIDTTVGKTKNQNGVATQVTAAHKGPMRTKISGLYTAKDKGLRQIADTIARMYNVHFISGNVYYNYREELDEADLQNYLKYGMIQRGSPVVLLAGDTPAAASLASLRLAKANGPHLWINKPELCEFDADRRFYIGTNVPRGWLKVTDETILEEIADNDLLKVCCSRRAVSLVKGKACIHDAEIACDDGWVICGDSIRGPRGLLITNTNRIRGEDVPECHNRVRCYNTDTDTWMTANDSLPIYRKKKGDTCHVENVVIDDDVDTSSTLAVLKLHGMDRGRLIETTTPHSLLDATENDGQVVLSGNSILTRERAEKITSSTKINKRVPSLSLELHLADLSKRINRYEAVSHWSRAVPRRVGDSDPLAVSQGYLKMCELMDVWPELRKGTNICCLAEGAGGFAQRFGAVSENKRIHIVTRGAGSHQIPNMSSLHNTAGEGVRYTLETVDIDKSTTQQKFDLITVDGGESHCYRPVSEAAWMGNLLGQVKEFCARRLLKKGRLLMKVRACWGREMEWGDFISHFGKVSFHRLTSAKVLSPEFYMLCENYGSTNQNGRCGLLRAICELQDERYARCIDLLGNRLVHANGSPLPRGDDWDLKGTDNPYIPLYTCSKRRFIEWGGNRFELRADEILNALETENRRIGMMLRDGRIVRDENGPFRHLRQLARLSEHYDTENIRLRFDKHSYHCIRQAVGLDYATHSIGATIDSSRGIMERLKKKADIAPMVMTERQAQNIDRIYRLLLRRPDHELELLDWDKVEQNSNKQGSVGFFDEHYGNLGDCLKDADFREEVDRALYEEWGNRRPGPRYVTGQNKNETKAKKNVTTCGGITRVPDGRKSCDLAPRLIRFGDMKYRLMQSRLYGEVEELWHQGKLFPCDPGWSPIVVGEVVDIAREVFEQVLTGDFTAQDHRDTAERKAIKFSIVKDWFAEEYQPMVHTEVEIQMNPVEWIKSLGIFMTHHGQTASGHLFTSSLLDTAESGAAIVGMMCAVTGRQETQVAKDAWEVYELLHAAATGRRPLDAVKRLRNDKVRIQAAMIKLGFFYLNKGDDHIIFTDDNDSISVEKRGGAYMKSEWNEDVHTGVGTGYHAGSSRIEANCIYLSHSYHRVEFPNGFYLNVPWRNGVIELGKLAMSSKSECDLGTDLGLTKSYSKNVSCLLRCWFDPIMRKICLTNMQVIANVCRFRGICLKVRQEDWATWRHFGYHTEIKWGDIRSMVESYYGEEALGKYVFRDPTIVEQTLFSIGSNLASMETRQLIDWPYASSTRDKLRHIAHKCAAILEAQCEYVTHDVEYDKTLHNECLKKHCLIRAPRKWYQIWKN